MKNAIPKTNEHRWRHVLVLGFAAILLGGTAEAQIDSWKLNPDLAAGGVVRTFQISPDGQWVVYQAAVHTPNAYELYSVPIDGGPSVRLNGALPAGTEVSTWRITPDSLRVVFAAAQENLDFRELFSVPIEGPASAATKLNKTLPAGGNVGILPGRTAFEISPDSTRVVYVADQDVDDTYELYSVPVVGPAAAGIRLNPPLVSGGNVAFDSGLDLVFMTEISPNSQWVVYYADQEMDERYELYSVPIDGPSSAVVKLNGPIVPNGELSSHAQISPDSSRVVYRGAQLQAGVFELFSVPIAGPSSAGEKLNDTLPANGDVGSYLISPDSSRVVYVADQDVDGTRQLYSINIGGPSGSDVRLNWPLLPNWEVKWFYFTFNGQRVVYSSGLQGGNTKSLYSAPVTGPANYAILLTSLQVELPHSYSFGISPDDRWVVYEGMEGGSTTELLFSVRAEGGNSTNVRLATEAIQHGSVGRFGITPDSGGVVYTRTILGVGQDPDFDNLYYTPIRGPATARIQLNGPLVRNGNVVEFLLSPKGDRVVYKADQETDGVPELYTATAPLAAAGNWVAYR